MDYIALFELWYVLYPVLGTIFILIGVLRLLLRKKLCRCKRKEHIFIIISIVFIIFGVSCLTIGPVIVDKVVTYHKMIK